MRPEHVELISPWTTPAIRSAVVAPAPSAQSDVLTLVCLHDVADALVEALDAGMVQLERNGQIQKSARGIWMRYSFEAAGACVMGSWTCFAHVVSHLGC